MNSKTNIQQERICGALLHLLLLAGLFMVFARAARPQDCPRVANRVTQAAKPWVNDFLLHR